MQCPELKPVISSLIEAIGYDPIRQVLYVKFPNGSLYCYFEVGPNNYKGLVTAPSIGAHFTKNFKYAYKYERLSMPTPKA